jgi:hypothetical protein
MLKEMPPVCAVPDAQMRSCPVKLAELPHGKARKFTRPG